MARSALGKGLDSLMDSGQKPAAPAPAVSAVGVQLLLHTNRAEAPQPPVTATPVVPGWIPSTLVAADIFLVLLAGALAFVPQLSGRGWFITALILTGFGLFCLALHLRSIKSAPESATSEPVAEPARLRVRFMGEAPQRR